jgi:prolipoprotein diacylglyceryltransferase
MKKHYLFFFYSFLRYVFSGRCSWVYFNAPSDSEAFDSPLEILSQEFWTEG